MSWSGMRERQINLASGVCVCEDSFSFSFTVQPETFASFTSASESLIKKVPCHDIHVDLV